jgi:hypothetical protein
LSHLALCVAFSTVSLHQFAPKQLTLPKLLLHVQEPLFSTVPFVSTHADGATNGAAVVVIDGVRFGA